MSGTDQDLAEYRLARGSCSTATLPSSTGEIVVLRIAGEVALCFRHLVRAALVALLDRRPPPVLVDASGLGFCNVRGLAMLVQAAAATTNNGMYRGALSTLAASDDPADLAHILATRLHAALAVFTEAGPR